MVELPESIQRPPQRFNLFERSGGELGTGHHIGRDYEDFKVGDVYLCGTGFTISEGWHQQFCLLTGNDHPLHTDAEWCKKGGHKSKRRVVVGVGLLALATGKGVHDFSGRGINPGYEEVTFTAPTFEGDTLYVYVEILEKRVSERNPTQGIVKGKMYFVVKRVKVKDYDVWGGNPEDGCVVGHCVRTMLQVPVRNPG